MADLSKREWWREAVLYQIYPRSFADGNGDGIGDLPGVTAKLDYLEWLGVDALWLNPIYPSPNVDWGYDVADYTAVHPDLGTLDDLDRLVAEAGRRGLRVLLDLVPNHTSIEHPWFRERPELYWWSPEVRAEFERILRFWFDRGVAGFRIDVAHGLVKDRELRDDPSGARVYSMNRPETHEIFRAWRRIADSYEPPRVLVGEVYVLDVPVWASYYGSCSDELHLAFNFALVHAELDAAEMRRIVAATEAALPVGARP